MTKRTVRIREGEPLFDLVSFGRSGPQELGGRFTQVQIAQIRRTVMRAPEVVVKVLPRSSDNLKAVSKHLDYICRNGKLELETDDGERTSGQISTALLNDWDLDIDDVRRLSSLAGANGRKAPKLVHKLMFSMPPGTPPEKLVEAVRNVAREQFALRHRYAFVLHTDEPHPHVHLLLKAVSSEGERLNIKKSTLRIWRSEFARNLRLLGVEANATERAVRGARKTPKKDGIYRASLRERSTYIVSQEEGILEQLAHGSTSVDSGKKALEETRRRVVQGWNAVAVQLARQGDRELADRVVDFTRQLHPTRTDRESLIDKILARKQTLQRPDPRRSR